MLTFLECVANLLGTFVDSGRRQLNSTHRADMESAISQHKHQSQIMLSEFNKAKELLNQKLHATEKRYVAMFSFFFSLMLKLL